MGMDCPNRCGGSIVEFSLELPSGPLTMSSCSVCDRRSWERRGESLEIGSVLEEIACSPLRRAG